MVRQWGVGVLLAAAAVSIVSAQAQKPAAGKGTTYDITIAADGGAYTGTMTLLVVKGAVTGDMHITKPGEITGKVAGTVKAGEMALDFPYRMVERKCDGQIAMNLKAPAKGAGSNGTVSIVGCGRDASNKLAGTVELKPATVKK